MIPEVAARGLAVFADVFCERGVFSVEESRRILVRAREHGLKLRLHADELATTGGAELAAELGARSADHLVFVSEAGMRALAAASCTATLLPTAAFYLRLGRFAPARALVAAGAPIALASDVNPGGGLSPSLPFAMALGCFAMGLALEEALAAVTINAAFSLDRQADAGLARGRQARRPRAAALAASPRPRARGRPGDPHGRQERPRGRGRRTARGPSAGGGVSGA